MQSPQVQIITSASMGATVTSAVVSLKQYFGCAFQAAYNGTSLDGIFSLEASVNYEVDPEGRVLVAGNWSTIPNTSVTLTAATAGTYLQNLPDANYPYVRLVYTFGVGDVGTLNAWVCKKGF